MNFLSSFNVICVVFVVLLGHPTISGWCCCCSGFNYDLQNIEEPCSVHLSLLSVVCASGPPKRISSVAGRTFHVTKQQWMASSLGCTASK